MQTKLSSSFSPERQASNVRSNSGSSRLSAMAKPEQIRALQNNRRTPAKWVGGAIYGLNDGLGAIFGIVAGVSGATMGNGHTVLIAGLAGGMASAISMGVGAYLSAQSEREIYQAVMYRKREELRNSPELCKRELSLVYQTKGMPESDAATITELLAKDEGLFAQAVAAEELSAGEYAVADPTRSALCAALSTAVGALIPTLPFFVLAGAPAVATAAFLSLAAYFGIGAAKSLVTVRPWWLSAMEMTLVGILEGTVTYSVGLGLGRLGIS